MENDQKLGMLHRQTDQVPATGCQCGVVTP